jgi:hypothetical protein
MSIWTSTFAAVLELSRISALLVATLGVRPWLQTALVTCALVSSVAQMASVALGTAYNLVAVVFGMYTGACLCCCLLCGGLMAVFARHPATQPATSAPLPTLTPSDGAAHFEMPDFRGDDGGGWGMDDDDDDDDEAGERELLEPATPSRGAPSPSQHYFLETLSPWRHPGQRYRYLHRMPVRGGERLRRGHAAYSP